MRSRRRTHHSHVAWSGSDEEFQSQTPQPAWDAAWDRVRAERKQAGLPNAYRSAALERRIVEQARRGRIRVIGPDSLGVMSPMTGLNATVASAMAKPGKIAFLSQSGALGTAVLDWSLRAHLGFSAFVSVGEMLDVGWGDLIDYLGNDTHTRSILIYMESIGDARSFLSAAHEVALTKPIIVIKPGHTEEASRAAVAHTGSLTGSNEVLDAAFRRCGVLRVDRISELFSMAEILNTQPQLKGPRLTILTNAGGPGVLATDALIDGGGQLAHLASESIESLNRILPPPWSHGNPVDLLGDASPDRYARALEVVAKDPNTDGVLVILTPQAMTDPTQTADKLKAQGTTAGKPVLASWMGGTRSRPVSRSCTAPTSRRSPTPTPPPAPSTTCGATARTSAACTRRRYWPVARTAVPIAPGPRS